MMTKEDQIVKIAKAHSDKTRVKMLREIAKKGSISCGDAEEIASLSQPTVSHHCKILTDAGLLISEKIGRHVIISVNKKAVEEFSSLISNSIKTNEPVELAK